MKITEIRATQMSKTDKIIIGIDPGTLVLGFGIVRLRGTEMKLVDMGVIKLDKIDDHALRLKKIYSELLAIFDKHHPDELAIEAPFFGKNVQSMLKLGRAQGVSIAAAMSREIPIYEYSPKKIKQSITGNGNASKEQVASMLSKLLHFGTAPKYLDATDGLAVAVCHHFQNKVQSGKSKSYSGWKAFLAANPERKK